MWESGYWESLGASGRQVENGNDCKASKNAGAWGRGNG